MTPQIILDIKYPSDASTLINTNKILAGDLLGDEWDDALDVLDVVMERYQSYCEPPDFLDDTLQELRGILHAQKHLRKLKKTAEILRYAVRKHDGDDDYIVVDREMQTDVCICSSDPSYRSANTKAHLIAYVLNEQHILSVEDDKSEKK